MSARAGRRAGRLAPALAATLTVATLAASCTQKRDDPGANDRTGEAGPPASAVIGTVPPAVSPGSSLPAPDAVRSLDGVRVRLRRIGEARVPVAFTARPGTDNLYLAEQGGGIKRITVDKRRDNARKVVTTNFDIDARPILDLTGSIASGGERGLLGLAFSPDGGRLYVYYTGRSGEVTIDEYRMDGDTIDVRSKRNLVRIDHPRGNHNGGQLAFGPDDYLYVGTGDGGGAGDPDRNGQNPHTLLGKILRIDPRGSTDGKPYGIPRGNPFGDGERGAPEVWSYGLRNPWRFSFDRLDGDLWIGDVGQNKYEEIDLLVHRDGGAGAGANLGWNLMEGSHPYDDGMAPEGHVPPIFDYDRTKDGRCSVVGGFVHRGDVAAWRGVYFWADYCDGELHTLLRGDDDTVEDRGTGIRPPVGAEGGFVTSFGQSLDGELFVLSAAGGIYLLEDGA